MKGAEIKKIPRTHTKKPQPTIFACHSLETLEQKTLGFEERKARAEYHYNFPPGRARMFSLGLCRLLHADPTRTMAECHRMSQVFCMCNCGSAEKEQNSIVFLPPPLRAAKALGTFYPLWAGLRGTSEVLKRVAAFLCEMQRKLF